MSEETKAAIRHQARQVTFESYGELGYNYRLTDIQAAVGREQLKRLPEIVARRREQAAHYGELLADVPGLVLPLEPEWARSNWQSYSITIPEGLTSQQIVDRLTAEEKVDLLVVGTHQRRALGKLWSVSHHALRLARMSVAAVPSTAATHGAEVCAQMIAAWLAR